MRAFLHRPRNGAKTSTRPRIILLCLAAATLAACNGADGPTTPPKPIPNFVELQSDPGDFVGGGKSYEYTRANAVITAVDIGYLSLRVDGDQRWQTNVHMPDGGPLRAGTYTGAVWTGEGRGCGTADGTITIDSVAYAGNLLAAIDFRLDQHCVGSTAHLRATVHWRADDPTMPPGPVTPVPATLWKPDPSLTPALGNYVALVSDPGDFIGQGFTQTFTSSQGPISAAVVNGVLTVTVGGTGDWHGEFKSMLGIPAGTVGYYPDLMRYPFNNPAKGGLDWYGQGRGCNKLTGWFVVDRAVFLSGTLTALDLRFEQRCEGFTPALRGAVHWTA